MYKKLYDVNKARIDTLNTIVKVQDQQNSNLRDHIKTQDAIIAQNQVINTHLSEMAKSGSTQINTQNKILLGVITILVTVVVLRK